MYEPPPRNDGGVDHGSGVAAGGMVGELGGLLLGQLDAGPAPASQDGVCHDGDSDP
jgi:hypothetical protein